LGVVLLIGWSVSLRTVFVSLGWLGVILGVALLAALAWVFVDQKWLDLDTPSSVAWLALLILGTVLGIGLSWSLIRARLTGQVEVQ
jgi:Mg/Co/Ni transporter MgtE